MTQKRNSNLDLLRIICMLMIVSLHFYSHGGLINHALSPHTANWYIGNLCYALCCVSVNCMVMLTGYFQCTSRFKLRRFGSVWLQAFFYSVALYLAASVTTGDFSPGAFVKSGMVMTMKQYWYVTAYLLLYGVSPFLNCAIRAMSKRMHLMCCCVLLGLFSLLHNMVYTSDFGNILGGSSFLWFCVLYTVAAYIRLHVPVDVRHRRIFFPGYFLCAGLIALERFLAYWITPMIFGRVVMDSLFFSYNSILTAAAAIFLFLGMRTVDIKGSFINRAIETLASLTFGVYLIHDHPAIRPLLWQLLNPAATAQSPWMVPYALVCVCGVFLCCCGAEWLRQQVFRLLGIDALVNRCCDRIQNIGIRWLTESNSHIL